MKKSLLFLFIFTIVLSPNLFCQKEDLLHFNEEIKRSKFLKSYFINKSSNDYLHLGFLQTSKKLMLDKFPLSYFSSDSIIFVEIYGRETLGYLCGVYTTGNKPISYYAERGNLIKIEILKEKTSADKIIEEIRKGNLFYLLKKGATSKIHPESYIYITIAVRKGCEYNIESYFTKSFLL